MEEKERGGIGVVSTANVSLGKGKQSGSLT
jgi:hypothetical protein